MRTKNHILSIYNLGRSHDKDKVDRVSGGILACGNFIAASATLKSFINVEEYFIAIKDKDAQDKFDKEVANGTRRFRKQRKSRP